MPPSLPSITGGAATSGNGDSVFSADGNQLGGLNYNKGISPYWLLGAAAIGLVVYVSSKSK